jgi:predicted dehydrogenase
MVGNPWFDALTGTSIWHLVSLTAHLGMDMNRCLIFLGLMLVWTLPVAIAEDDPMLRIGVIGLDTSHVPSFTKSFNQEPPAAEMRNCRVVAAYPYGSRDIESSYSRIPQFTEQVKAMGVEIVESIDDLLAKVDCVLLETNDGKPHLEQALQVFAAGKPVFIDKPIAQDLANAIAIFRAAEHYNVPMFSSSSLRYTSAAQAIRGGSIGRVLGCETYSPCKFEPSHVDLFWYGIHGVEPLLTCLGEGCQSVRCVSTDTAEVVTGTWNDGRVGTFRGIRSGKSGYGGTAFGESQIASVGPYEGYQPLVMEIAKFFRTGTVPIQPTETIEIYAFMQAAMQSKQGGGKPVSIADVIKDAEAKATELLKGKLTQ